MGFEDRAAERDNDAPWSPVDIDVEKPSPARMYDYYLGGAHNFAADRRLAEQTMAVFPEVSLAVQANRAFLRRAVQFLVDAGIRQFLDIGSGIPTVGHVHEIAQDVAPDARVIYVDIDPVAVAHSQEILAGNDRTAVIQEDARKPDKILEHPEVRRLLDLQQPIAVLLVALFHFIPDADDPRGILARLMEPLAAGSYLAISHGTEDGTQDAAKGRELYRRAGINWTSRPRSQVEALFTGWDLVEPGLVWVPLWRPESTFDVYHDQPESSAIYAGVARKN